MSENMYLGIFYIYSVFHITCVVPGTGSAATYVVQKETKPRDFPPRRTKLVSGFQFSNCVSILQHSVCSVQLQRENLVSRSWKSWNLQCGPAWAAVGGREK